MVVRMREDQRKMIRWSSTSVSGNVQRMIDMVFKFASEFPLSRSLAQSSLILESLSLSSTPDLNPGYISVSFWLNHCHFLNMQASKRGARGQSKQCTRMVVVPVLTANCMATAAEPSFS